MLRKILGNELRLQKLLLGKTFLETKLTIVNERIATVNRHKTLKTIDPNEIELFDDKFEFDNYTDLTNKFEDHLAYGYALLQTEREKFYQISLFITYSTTKIEKKD